MMCTDEFWVKPPNWIPGICLKIISSDKIIYKIKVLVMKNQHLWQELSDL
jgi:hypothetical protein